MEPDRGLWPSHKATAKAAVALAVGLAIAFMAVPASASKATAIGGSVTTQGNHWLLNGQPFIPVIDYSDDFYPLSSTPDNACIQAGQVPTYLATGAQIVLVNQPSKRSPACGTTQAEQVAAMHQALAGRMAWNYGADQAVLAPDASQPNEAEVITWPATHLVLPPSGYRAEAGVASLVGDELSYLGACGFQSADLPGLFPLTWQLLPDLKQALSTGPALAGIDISKRLNCATPAAVAAEFWGAVGMGGGVYWTLTDFNDGNSFDPVPKLVTEAGKLTRQLACVSPAILHGRPLKLAQPKNVKVPVWQGSSGSFAVHMEKPKYPVRYLFGWKYQNKIYVLATSEGLFGGRLATHWVTHVNGKWHQYSWSWPALKVKLAGLGGYKATGLCDSAKALAAKGNQATIKLGTLGAKWFVLAPKRK